MNYNKFEKIKERNKLSKQRKDYGEKTIETLQLVVYLKLDLIKKNLEMHKKDSMRLSL